MPYGIGGAIAEGIRSGWQLGLETDAAKQHKIEFEREQADRDVAQQRLQKQEDDRYGRMNDAARVAAVQQRIGVLEKLRDAAIAAGHRPSPEVGEEWSQLQVQLENMQNQIATTGRLAPPGGVASAAPRPNVASADMGAAPQPAAQPGQPVQSAPAGPVTSAAPAPTSTPSAVGVTGLGPSTAPAGTPPPMDDTGADPNAPAMPGAAPPAAAVSSPVSSARSPAQQYVADADQQSQNLASRLQTGQTSIGQLDPGDFALMLTSATKRHPDDLPAVQQHLDDFHAGMATGNNGLTLQGVNGLFGPQIAQGVGAPSAYGGTITGKSVIGLDPALSADGAIHSDKVIPRLNVTTDVMGADGQPLSYHAPMTQNRSSDPNDPVTAVPMGDAVNQIGALGSLVAVAQTPQAQALLAKGKADPRVQKYLDYYNQAAQPPNPALVKEQQVTNYMKAAGVDRDTAVQRMVQLGALPWQPTKGIVGQTMESAQQLVTNGDAPDLPSALRMLQAGGVTKQPTKYSPGAGVGVGGGGSSGGGGALPGSAPGAGGAPMLPADFLAKLSPEDRQSVLTVARDPSTIANVSTAKGRREHVQNLVEQYLQTQNALSAVSIGKGVSGIDAQGNPVGGVNPESVRLFTDATIAGNDTWKTQLGRGAQGQAMVAAVNSALPSRMAELGLSASDLGSNKAQYAALTKTLADRTKYVTAVNQLQGTLTAQADLVKSLLAKGGATEGGPLFNAPYNKIREALGSVDAHNLDVALTGLAREHQRVIVSPLSNGQLAVSAQATGDKLANLNLTPSQILGTINVMETEAANARTQGQATLEGVKSQLSGLGKGTGAAPAAPGGKLVYNPATGGFSQ